MNEMERDEDMDLLQKAMEDERIALKSDIMPTKLRDLKGLRYFQRQPAHPFTFPKFGHLIRGSNQTFFQLVEGWVILPVWHDYLNRATDPVVLKDSPTFRQEMDGPPYPKPTGSPSLVTAPLSVMEDSMAGAKREEEAGWYST